MSDNERVLRRVNLGPQHRPTGFTRHYRGNLLPPPAELRIARIGDDPGFYLLYYDSSGSEQTDTYHDSLALALEQARLEFNVEPDDWEVFD